MYTIKNKSELGTRQKHAVREFIEFDCKYIYKTLSTELDYAVADT